MIHRSPPVSLFETLGALLAEVYDGQSSARKIHTGNQSLLPFFPSSCHQGGAERIGQKRGRRERNRTCPDPGTLVEPCETLAKTIAPLSSDFPSRPLSLSTAFLYHSLPFCPFLPTFSLLYLFLDSYTDTHSCQPRVRTMAIPKRSLGVSKNERPLVRLPL